MTTHRVAEHWHVHQCPAHTGPHPWSIARTVVDTTEAGPCLAPVILRAVDLATGRTFSVRVRCARRAPLADRCANCTPVVEVVRISLHVTPVGRNR